MREVSSFFTYLHLSNDEVAFTSNCPNRPYPSRTWYLPLNFTLFECLSQIIMKSIDFTGIETTGTFDGGRSSIAYGMRTRDGRRGEIYCDVSWRLCIWWSKNEMLHRMLFRSCRNGIEQFFALRISQFVSSCLISVWIVSGVFAIVFRWIQIIGSILRRYRIYCLLNCKKAQTKRLQLVEPNVSNVCGRFSFPFSKITLIN